MKNILGLDLGTNSIGWAKISIDENEDVNPSISLGSRIIPMTQDTLGKFDSGVTESATAERTSYRGTRRLRERCLLRRERLFRILHTLGFLPEHFDNAIGWEKNDNKTYGKFIDDTEPKLAWKENSNGKMEFLFMDSFNEMLEEFRKSQPALLDGGKLIPFDWTLYYLRRKALREAITKYELAWILLNFNQKRGYYQLRGEDSEENKFKKEEYHVLMVVGVEAEESKKQSSDKWYNVTLENGWVYRRKSKTPLNDWIGKKREFIVTTEYEEDGSVKLDKDGKEKRSFRAPGADDWSLQKKRVEDFIENSGLHVGEYVFEHLLCHPDDKIRGQLIRTIERDFYKSELKAILAKQAEFIPELTDRKCLDECIVELYAKNIAHQESLRKKDLQYLIVEDLLFYQRPLKSKKSLIGNCPYEQYSYVDKSTGEIKIQHIKCIAKSNPYYQEFRLWQFIQNLRLYKNEGVTETDVTSEYLNDEESVVRLYSFLNDRKDITQDILLKEFFNLKKPKGKDSKYPIRWNYVEDKSYPCNETRSILLSAFKKSETPTEILDNIDEEYRLWHLLYSVDDRKELEHALHGYAHVHGFEDSFVESFKKIPSFKKEYGAYSEKAIKKLLSVMRVGSAWSESLIPGCVDKIISCNADEHVMSRLARAGYNFSAKEEMKGLPVWVACYLIYGRHSEASEVTKWNTPSDLKAFINNFKQYSLRNPIVEQCILETLRTVHDIWEKCGHIDEIHVELGRSMKSTAEQRKRDTERITQNENTNLRIKQLLMELKNDPEIADVRPYSPMQQDILRIYEEGALMELKRDDEDYAEISRISHLATPTQNELTRYKLWLEQKYRSPYTGKTISLTKLFTPAYQIEHVIPQGRFFDDSFSNKVICEAEVNQRKTNMLGLEFIKKCGGEIILCAGIGKVKVFNEQEYRTFIEEHYSANKAKARKLMMDDIPEEFIQRQMNDSRYISKVIIGLLSNIVREENEVEAVSKNVIPCTGGITDRLKKDWGLNDVWNHIVSPRFERMNQLTGSDAFGHWENKEGKRVFQTTMPIELQKGFSKKRIDHRHHAMDALVIALASRNIVSYLNNCSAKDTERREDLRRMLCDKNRIIRKPWATFTQDAEYALQNILVSFKHYIRVINKATNYYEHYNANGKKELIQQQSSEQWAIRKPLHDQYVFGQVNLLRKKKITLRQAIKQPDAIVDKKIRHCVIGLMEKESKYDQIEKQILANNLTQDVSKIEIFYFTDEHDKQSAIRRELDISFNEEKINKITDTGIQVILKNFLKAKGGIPEVAFSPEGIAEMNDNIQLYNNGKHHKPIIKVRVCEALGAKFMVGQSGNKKRKFVQGAPHLYFAIYENNEGKRRYKTHELKEVIERLKCNMPPVPEFEENGFTLKFWLSPNDLVYMPSDDDLLSPSKEITDTNRIYRFISSENSKAYFLPASVANVIGKKIEFESGNKSEKSISISRVSDKNVKLPMIKQYCWKLEVNRLGEITKIIR